MSYNFFFVLIFIFQAAVLSTLCTVRPLTRLLKALTASSPLEMLVDLLGLALRFLQRGVI